MLYLWDLRVSDRDILEHSVNVRLVMDRLQDSGHTNLTDERVKSANQLNCLPGLAGYYGQFSKALVK